MGVLRSAPPSRAENVRSALDEPVTAVGATGAVPTFAGRAGESATPSVAAGGR